MLLWATSIGLSASITPLDSLGNSEVKRGRVLTRRPRVEPACRLVTRGSGVRCRWQHACSDGSPGRLRRLTRVRPSGVREAALSNRAERLSLSREPSGAVVTRSRPCDDRIPREQSSRQCRVGRAQRRQEACATDGVAEFDPDEYSVGNSIVCQSLAGR
jgi:hypothetical protein